MTVPKRDWKRLLELLETFFQLDEREREGWIERLGGADAELRGSLRHLIAQRGVLVAQNFLATPVAFARTSVDPAAAALSEAPPATAAAAAGLGGAIATPTGVGSTTTGDSIYGVELGPDEVKKGFGGVPPPAAGMVLGHFRLLEELGTGGMGRVFKAEDAWAKEVDDPNPYVAVKVLNEEFKAHPDAEVALQREAKRAHTLAHPNVITVYQFDRDGPYSYMTMEYLQGRPLDVLLASDFAAGICYERAWPIIQQICAALEYGHTKVYENKKGIVHADLKPGNVFVCNDGTVKVLDFGISRPISAGGEPGKTTHFDPGTRLRGLSEPYAALEMWSPGSPDPRDDIYALGCITYEVLTGRHPFDHNSAPAAVAARMCPARIESLTRLQWDALRRTLAFRRNERTASVAAFVCAFEPRSFTRRHAVVLGVAGAAAILGMLAASAHLYRSYIEQDMVTLEFPSAPVHVEATAEQRKQVAGYLAQANETLSMASLSMSPDDLSYFLSEGANNAHEIINAALAIEPDNAEARRMEDQIARLYAQKARALLDSGSVAPALKLVRNGLKTQPHNRELLRLQMGICRGDPAACVAARAH
jgi:serine/threonine protein kinase